MRPARRLLLVALGAIASAGLAPPARALAQAPAAEVPYPPCASAAGGAIAVLGGVVDERGRPVVGARVEASGRVESGDFGCLESTRTSSAGRFRLSFSRPGNYQVLASLPGRAPALSSVAVVASQPVPSLGLALGPGHGLAGRVTDDAGRPIAGARLALWRDRSGTQMGHLFYQWHADDDRYRATTGAGGRFSLHDLPAGRFALDVRAPGIALPLAGAAVEVRADASTTDLGTLVLPRGDRLAGRVADPAGRPVAGAQVWLVSPGDHEIYWDWGQSFYEAGPAATTGADGRFALAGFDGRYDVEVCRPGYLRAYLQPASAAEALAVELRPAATFSGRVVDASGRPVAGAEIAAFPGWQVSGDLIVPGTPCGRLLSTQTASDRLGRFTLTNVEPGWARLDVQAKGFVHPAAKPVYGTPGETAAGIEVQLARGATLKGRITQPDGRPSAGEFVLIWRGGSAEGAEDTETDGRGEYSVQLAPGAYRIVEPEDRRIRLPPGGARLDLAAGKGPSWRLLHGRVLDAAGRPVAGARIEAHEGRTWTGADGRYVLAAQEDATLVDVIAEGHATAWSRDREVRLAEGHELTGRLLGLAPRDLAAVAIRASPAHGAPIGGVVEVTGTIDAAGRYRIAGLAAGDWNVYAFGGGRDANVVVAVEPGRRTAVHDVVFPPPGAPAPWEAPPAGGAVLAGNIVGLEPGEVARVTVEFPAASNGSMTDRDGRYRIPGVPAGRHALFATLGGDEGWRVSGELAIPAGAREATFDLAFPPRDRSLVLRLAGAADLLDLDATVHSLDVRSVPTGGSVIPGEDGTVRFDRLPAGRYRVEVRRQGVDKPIASRDVDLTAPGATSADLAIDLAAHG